MNRMASSPHIVLVEDDREITALVSRFLSANNIRVSAAPDGRAMDKVLKERRIDLIVLDIMLPGEDGLRICRRIRATSNIPIIMMTAKGEDIDRILGLEIGADDYLAKPFNPRELLARIHAVLRRGAFNVLLDKPELATLTFDGWQVEKRLRRLLNPEGVRVSLTGAEFDLLMVFCEHPQRVLSREQLLDLTQGRASTPFDRSVDILVSRLRQKMEKDPKQPMLIQTIRSAGYMFSPYVERL